MKVDPTPKPIPKLSAELIAKFWARMKRLPSGCWEWTGGFGSNYGVMNLGAAHGKRSVYAHRVAFAIAHGDIPPGLIILHSCGGRCVNPAHLRAGTHKENAQDRLRSQGFKDHE